MADIEKMSDSTLCTARAIAVLGTRYNVVDLERDIAAIGIGVCFVLGSGDPFATTQIINGCEGEWPEGKVEVDSRGIFIQFVPTRSTQPLMGLWMGYESDLPTLILHQHTPAGWTEVVRCWAHEPRRFISVMGADRRTHHDWSTTLIFLNSVLEGLISST